LLAGAIPSKQRLSVSRKQVSFLIPTIADRHISQIINDHCIHHREQFRKHRPRPLANELEHDYDQANEMRPQGYDATAD
jgi:hypothetical protein